MGALSGLGLRGFGDRRDAIDIRIVGGGGLCAGEALERAMWGRGGKVCVLG